MESQKPKIAMYVKRPFGEKLNASFDFIKENWKQLFKYSTYLILPICLIQAANFSGLMGSLFIFLYINLNIDLGKRVYVKYNYGLRWLF